MGFVGLMGLMGLMGGVERDDDFAGGDTIKDGFSS